MSVRNRATLRLLDKADKQIRKLDRSVKGALYEFQYKFRENPERPSLNLERLENSELYSARLNNDYRALLLHIGDQNYILVAVKPHNDVYRNLYRYQVNPVSGGLEFIDLEVVESAVATPEPEAGETDTAGPAPLFAAFDPARLVELGVAEPLLPAVARLTTEAELNELLNVVPRLTAEVLYELYVGTPPDEIAERVTAPVRASEPVDTSDYGRAADRPATAATDDVDLLSVIDDPFADWRVYLHPAQRHIVERTYGGPARISGGPGTGKTVVALHRVRHLVRQSPPGAGRILLTTFNTNLAADLRHRLNRLGVDGDRVDVANIDKLAAQVVAESSGGGPRRLLSDSAAVKEWEALLDGLGETEFSPRFVHDEWTQVILGQAINDRAEYFRARRAGRGAKLGRAQRARIWALVERFTQHLDERGMGTFAQVAEQAARLEAERAEGGQHRYRHVVVDEAQDLSAAHWKMLRAMAAEQPDDLFLTGDPHQRIYQHQVSLGSLSVHIRGRSAKLTVSYRTTRQILRSAVGILAGETFDDLDDGVDDLRGYRSLLRGGEPEFRQARDQAAELDLVVERVQDWAGGEEPSAIGVCVPERRMVGAIKERLARVGIPAVEIRSSGPPDHEAVHVGTMHRFKGLEYRRMIIAGADAGNLPPGRLDAYRHTDPAFYRQELRRYRSLLFVAATRARDELLICWYGRPSPFLPLTDTAGTRR